MKEITIVDRFLPGAIGHVEAAKQQEFRSYDFEKCSFHGISICPLDSWVPMMASAVAWGKATLSFFRKSPLGQVEPHFIHTDVDMGDWSAILYLNQNPPEGDGTAFWRHIASGETENPVAHARSEEGATPEGWELRGLVEAKFNRLVVFKSSLFHSRAIFENWGDQTEARLTQVTFGVSV